MFKRPKDGSNWANEARLPALEKMAAEQWLNKVELEFLADSLAERKRSEQRWQKRLVQSLLDSSEASWKAHRELEALGAADRACAHDVSGEPAR